MNVFVSTLCAATLCAAVVTLSPIANGPASAAPVAPLALIGSGTQQSALDDLVEVQQRRYQRGRWGADRRGNDRRWRDNRNRRPPVSRPSRQQSRGPDLGSAIAGALIGGIIVNQFNQSSRNQAPVARSGSFLSNNHINWCQNRWRSYRISDNSYQPYNGPRRICTSPYGPS